MCDTRLRSTSTDHPDPGLLATRRVSRSRAFSQSTAEDARREMSVLDLPAKHAYFTSSGDLVTDHNKITMQTRVAVRDKTPHRFQIMPLKDASKFVVSQPDQPSHLLLPHGPRSYCPSSPTRSSSHYQARLHSSSSINSLSRKENNDVKWQEFDPNSVTQHSSTLRSSSHLETSASDRHPLPVGRRLLTDLDTNRTHRRVSVRSRGLSVSSLSKSTDKLSILAANSPHSRPPLPPLPKSTVYQESERFHRRKLDSTQDTLVHTAGTKSVRNRASSGALHTGDSVRWSGTSVTLQDVPKLDRSSRSSKRHAIYPESLRFPYTECGQNREDSDISCCGSPPLLQDADRQMKKTVSFELDYGDCNLKLDNHAETEGHNTVFDTCETRGLDSALESSISHLSVKSSSKPIPVGQPIISPLKYHRAATTKPLRKAAIVYPRAVLELFSTIDREIEDWSRIRGLD